MSMKKFSIVGTVCLLLICAAAPAQAQTWEPSLKPALFQSSLKAAGIFSERIASDPDTGYTAGIYMPNFKGSAVTIGFPAAGLRRGAPFLLEIDGMTATVQYDGDGTLKIIDGDQRVADSSVFGIIECILSNALESVGDLIDSIAHLNIPGIIQAVVKLVFGILDCDF
jgi:hypothetical protein